MRTCLEQVKLLALNAHSTVRQRGQLALLSCCRRYVGSVASSLPMLISILEDKDIDSAGLLREKKSFTFFFRC